MTLDRGPQTSEKRSNTPWGGGEDGEGGAEGDDTSHKNTEASHSQEIEASTGRCRTPSGGFRGGGGNRRKNHRRAKSSIPAIEEMILLIRLGVFVPKMTISLGRKRLK